MASVASSLNSWNDSKVLEYYGEYETWLVDIPSFLFHTDLPNYDSMFYGIFDSLTLSTNSPSVTVYDNLVIIDAILSALFGSPGPGGDSIVFTDLPKMVMGGNISVGSSLTWLDEIYTNFPNNDVAKPDSMNLLDGAFVGLLSVPIIDVGDTLTQVDSLASPMFQTSETTYIRRYLNDILRGS